MTEEQITTKRENGVISISIPEELLVFAVLGSDENLVITDKERFLDYVTKNIVTEEGFDPDSGLTDFYRLLDNLALSAAEDGEGVESEYE